MTTDEATEILTQAAKLRMPRFIGRRDPSGGAIQTSAGEKIAELEDFLLGTARWRSFLEEARLYMKQAQRDLQKRWDHMPDWEPYRRTGEKSVTSIQDAKRAKDPDLYDAIKSANDLIQDLSDQIRRLEHDDEVASRAYSFITGGS